MINAAIGSIVSIFFYWLGMIILGWLLIGFLSGVAISFWHYSRDKKKAELKNRLLMSFFFSVFGPCNVAAVWTVYQDEKDKK